MCRFCGFSNPGGETFLPCPSQPTVEVLMPIEVVDATCPLVCTSNPLETCFYDPACSGGGLGCGAGGRVNCRFCGFGPFDAFPCPAAAHSASEKQKQVEVAVKAGLPADLSDTMVQAKLNFQTHIQTQMTTALAGMQPNGRQAASLLGALRQSVCAFPGSCTTRLSNVALAFPSSAPTHGRALQTAPGVSVPLNVSLTISSSAPLPVASAALLQNATELAGRLTSMLAVNAILAGDVPDSTLAVAVLSTEDRLKVDVRLIRFGDSAAADALSTAVQTLGTNSSTAASVASALNVPPTTLPVLTSGAPIRARSFAATVNAASPAPSNAPPGSGSLTLKGVAPKIAFGEAGVVRCELQLKNGHLQSAHLESTCPIQASSGAVGHAHRRLDEVEAGHQRTQRVAPEAQLALIQEVAELKTFVTSHCCECAK